MSTSKLCHFSLRSVHSVRAVAVFYIPRPKERELRINSRIYVSHLSRDYSYSFQRVTHLYSSRFCESDFKQKYFKLNKTKFSILAIRQVSEVLWSDKKQIPSEYLFKIKLNIDFYFGKLKLTSSNSFCPRNSTYVFLFAISFYVVDFVSK